MYLDHPRLTATRSATEPDRIERINRVYGYAVGLADYYGNTKFLEKLAGLHDHKGNLIVTWVLEPTEAEKNYFLRAWQSKIGDESAQVEHEMESQNNRPLV